MLAASNMLAFFLRLVLPTVLPSDTSRRQGSLGLATAWQISTPSARVLHRSWTRASCRGA
jgi:hypothetical protein